nr:unnamed protein product [Digitaria exilis]
MIRSAATPRETHPEHKLTAAVGKSKRTKQAKDPEQYHGRIRLGSERTTDPSAPAEETPPTARSGAVEAAN